MRNNIITMTDSYKLTHWTQYPHKTEEVYSYFEARKGAKYNKTVFFGLQYLLKEYLTGKVVRAADITEAAELCKQHFGSEKIFNVKGWEHILHKHGGQLPVRIKAVPEGTPVEIDNVMMTIENTDPECFWLTNHLETLLTHVWAPSTVATLSREVKMMIDHYLDQTAEHKGTLPFMLHDFGYRGVSSVESAGICGAGHLISFLGTDTIRAMEVAKEYYGAKDAVAFSVPATEHSVMTSLGPDLECDLTAAILHDYPTGIVSIVIDSYDYMRFIEKMYTQRADEILNRDGKVVFRPDSGDPTTTTLEVVEKLGELFGYTTNKKGFKVLNPKVGVLWGDGIDYQGIRSILFTLQLGGWSAENLVFGMGGGLLQKVNRDTQRFAFKCSAQRRNGRDYEIFKQPRDITKTSKKGKLKLIHNGEAYQTVPLHGWAGYPDHLQTVFENGKLIKEYTFAEVRENGKL